MTGDRTITRKPLALLAGIVILVFGHSALQESATIWVRSLPFLLILILGELVREWTVSRLSPALDEPTVRARRRFLWLALIAGFGFLALPVAGIAIGLMPKHSAWNFLFFAAGIIFLGVSSAVMLVQAKARLDTKRAEAARTGVQPEHVPPGPFAFMLVLAGALVLFTLANATGVETLLARQSLSAMQWTRVLVSALLCGGFAFIAWRAINTYSDRLLNPSDPDLT